MKIVHMVASLKGGGIQNLILSLVPEQVRLGHKVSVIVTDEDREEQEIIEVEPYWNVNILSFLQIQRTMH